MSYKDRNFSGFLLRKASLGFLSALVLALPSAAQTPLEVRGKGSDIIVFPNGAASFADRVVTFQPGAPQPAEEFRQPDGALGVPDFQQTDGATYVSLGRAGVLTLEFVDNRLVDIPGNDLYIFEAGPDIESTFVEISEDGATWIEVGKIQGSTAYIDIGPKTRPGQQFRFVRLKDDPSQGGHSGQTPGADIDAVGAIGSVAAPASSETAPSPTGDGALTYFDAVAFYLPGALPVTWSNIYPQRILGQPDASVQGGGSMELGKGGSVVLLLSDHVALAGEGHDLVIFGDLKGPLKVEVSFDAKKWTTVAPAPGGGGRMEFGNLKVGVRYLRLTDEAGGKRNSTIDAVGAVRVRSLR
ncbi:MAG: hypothetical protein WC423_16810 [Vulcanimicrobiota bacterium]